MAKRKKQVNKNLVAGLVSAAMLLTVTVVGVLTAKAAQRDAGELAERAEAAEKAGDYRKALDLYSKAFRVDKETRYLIDASRCAYEMGEIRKAIGTLHQAHSQDPEDTAVLNELLERFWEMRNRGAPWEAMLELSDKMLALDEDSLLALVSRAKALDALKQRDPSYEAKSREAIEAAVEVDPLDPRVVEVQVREMFATAGERAATERANGNLDGAEEILEQVRAEVGEIFAKAIEKHKDSHVLYVNAAQVCIDNGSSYQARIEAAGSDEERAALLADQQAAYGQAEQLLEAGLKELPESERMLFAIGTYHRLRADQTFATNDIEACRRHVEAGLEAINRTLELEPAEYDAYTAKANLIAKQARLDGTWDDNPTAIKLELLEMLDDALADTVGLKTIRALMNSEGRARMLASAFDRGFEYFRETEDKDDRARIKVFLDSFRDRASQEYTESVLVQLLEGQLSILEGDTRAAIQAFSLAEDKARDIMPRYELLAKEQLARLYTYQEENGVALKYTNQAIELYSQAGGAPLDLWINRANLLIRVDQAKLALDQCDLLLEREDKLDAPSIDRLKRMKAAALHALERSDEAEALLATLEGTSVDLMRARIAAAREEYGQAEQIARKLIDANPDNTTAMTLAVQVMVQTERQAEALELIEATQARTESPITRRMLEAQKIVLQTEDPDERRDQLFAVIDEIDDPIQKAAEYFNYYYQEAGGVDDDEERVAYYARAAEYADQLEKLKPDDAQVYGIQFELAVRQKNWARAEQYVTRLAEKNADRAGGATYRAMLKRVRDDKDQDLPGAIAEFRAAERALPTDSNLKIQIGELLWLLQEYDAAIEKFSQAVELDPSNFLANKLLYRAMDQLGREGDTRAQRALDTAARLKPNDPYIKQKQQELTDLRNPAQGIANREARRAEDPEDLENLVKLGALYMNPQVRQYDKALECLEAARELAPADRRMAELAKGYYTRTDDLEGGEKVLKEYVASQEKLTQINAQLLLASFYARFDDAERTEGAFEQALEYAEALKNLRSERWRRGRLQVLEAMASYYENRGAAAGEAGNEELERESYAAAIERLRETLELYPEDDDRFRSDKQVSLVKIIQNMLKLGELEQADARIEEFRGAYPDDVRWLNAKAELWVRRGNSEEVRKWATRSIEKVENDPWAYWTRGRANMSLRNYEQARQDLLKVKELAPAGFNLRHRMQLAQLYMILEQYELAETELRALLELDKGNQKLALLLIRMLRNTGQSQRAQEFVNELIVEFPENPFWPATLGQILVQRKEYSAAIRPFQKAVELTNGESPQIVSEWLQAMLRADRVSEVIKAFERVETADADRPAEERVVTPFMLLVVAEANQKRNNETEMRARVEQALQQAASFNAPQLGFAAGRAAGLVGPDGVATILRSTREGLDEPGQLRIDWYLGRTLVNSTDAAEHERGMQAMDAVIAATDPGTVLHQEALLAKAYGFESAGNPEAAVGVYEQVLAANPRHWQSLNNAAYLLTSLGRSEQAISYAEKAAQLQPQNANVLDTRGWVLYQAGQHAQAESVLLEAASLEPNNLPVLSHLGQLYRTLNRDVEARRYYERLVRIATETNQRDTSYFKEAEEALKALN